VTARSSSIALEQKTRHGNGITSDIHHAAAAEFEHVPDVLGIAIKVTECAHDRLQLSDLAAADDLASAQPLRVGPHHERFANLHASFVSHLNKIQRLFGGYRDRFFAKNMLAGFGCADGPGYMQVIRQRIVNRVDIRIRQQLLIGAVRPFDPPANAQLRDQFSLRDLDAEGSTK